MISSNPINQLSNFENILTEFDKNKTTDWVEWLNLENMFKKPGKQGIVGIFRSKTQEKNTYVFKMSQQMDYLSMHEYAIMNSLNDLRSYCPHFCKSYGILECKRNPKYGKQVSDPFKITEDIKYLIKEDVVLIENIEKSTKLYNYIYSDKISENIIISIIKQVLLAVSIAQSKKQFTHYDLHSNNIMMKKCNKDVVFLYVIDEQNQFCVPTFGHYPVIIDFGFSYIKDMEDGPLWPSMGHTKEGFTSSIFNWVTDPKLFLVTVSDELKHSKPSKKSSKLRKIVKNIFGKMNIDMRSGWDTYDSETPSDTAIDMIEDISDDYSTIFYDEQNTCIDIIQTLIILPLEQEDTSFIRKSYKSFLKEWVKIESQISSTHYNLYILKGLVDAARSVRSLYLDKNTTQQAIEKFKNLLFERIQEISKFCNPKNLNCEIMLCSLYVFANSLEGVFYKAMENKKQIIDKENKKVLLESVEQIYAAIESNINDDYIYNKDTKIVIIDSNKEQTNIIKLNDKQIKEVNDAHSFIKGTLIYDYYK